MTDMTQSILSFIGIMTRYVSGAQQIPMLKPPKEEILMDTKNHVLTGVGMVGHRFDSQG